MIDTIHANIRWLTSGEPFSEQFHDFYFSTDGGLQETEYVFLQQNNILQRFSDQQQSVVRIGETGFGTGLNFLVTAEQFLKSAHPQCTLEYTSIEKYPLSYQQLQQVMLTFKKNWPQLTQVCDELLMVYSHAFNKKEQKLDVTLFDGRIRLILLIGDATQTLQTLLKMPYQAVDAWYLDGFSPAKNPDMWQDELFNALAKLSHKGTSISTFTSAGRVRRGLIAVGFTIIKVPGLGKKREILSGYFNTSL
ncbi:MAG: tRNA (5-methylaminomethyl-2-thiouridine)(34)-methyltransferase MnmD [Gammaproteobacteria bacterium]|nr:tRNA (5-methylaminomethyl-2-thiouridine)(34)-methyltransferase MnmD [Gammaproteobacteria bacterium]